MKRMANGDIFLPGMGRMKRIDPQKTAAENFAYTATEQKQNSLWVRLRNLRVEEGLAAYRLGDRLGAAWEGSGPTWTPTPYAAVLARADRFPMGTDESDTVDCFQGFAAEYDFAGDLDTLLVDWARWHALQRRVTRYGRTWKDYFHTVRFLDRQGTLTAAKLRQIALERNRGGSAGNGCLALALPVYAYAKRLNLKPTPWDGWEHLGTFGNGRSRAPVEAIGHVTTRTELVEAFVSLSHASPEALAAVRFLCFLFDLLCHVTERNVRIDRKVSRCREIDAYYHRPGRPAWSLSPEEFCGEFSQNVLCGGTLAHALYAIHNADSEQDLVCRVVSMRGDVDSVLALALMLWRLFFPVSKAEVAFANELYAPDAAYIGKMPMPCWRSRYL